MLLFIKKAWNFITTYWKVALGVLAIVIVGIVLLITLGKLGGANKVIQDLRAMILDSISALKRKNEQLAKEAEEIDKRIKGDKDKIKNEPPLVQPELPKTDKDLEDGFNKAGKKS